MNTVIIQQSWNHNVPSAADQQYDLQLLTICGVSVLGRWCGNIGEHYAGWAPLLGATRSQMQAYRDYSVPEDYMGETNPEPEQVYRQ